MPLEMVTGCASAAGARKNNEDYCGVVTPPESVRRTRGVDGPGILVY